VPALSARGTKGSNLAPSSSESANHRSHPAAYEDDSAGPDAAARQSRRQTRLSDADRKLDTNRAPAQWLAFIGAKPGMKVLDIFAVYGWKAELLARAVAPDGKVYAQNSEAAFTRVKDRLDARLKTPATANIVSVVRPFEDPAPRVCMISIW
jgi:predicted methyltransferase